MEEGNRGSDDYCLIHLTPYYTCMCKGCQISRICPMCSLQNKEKLKHYYNHYDSIVELKKEVALSYLNEDETYLDLNKIHLDNVTKINNKIKHIEDKLKSALVNFKQDIMEDYFLHYKTITSKTENTVKDLTHRLNNLQDIKSQEEIKKFKKELEVMINLLNNQELIDKEYASINEKKFDRLLNFKLSSMVQGNLLSLNLSTTSTVVFGNGKGNVIATSQQDNNPATNVLKRSNDGTHWNSDKSDMAKLTCFFSKPCIVKEILLAVRCAKYVTITGLYKGKIESTLVEKSETNFSDDATFSDKRILRYIVNYDNILDSCEIVCHTGGNVSLFWLEIIGIELLD